MVKVRAECKLAGGGSAIKTRHLCYLIDSLADSSIHRIKYLSLQRRYFMHATAVHPTIASLGLNHLSPIDRAHLAYELLDSIPPDDVNVTKQFGPTLELPDDEELEVANRLAEHRANPDSALTREEAREQLKALRTLRS